MSIDDDLHKIDRRQGSPSDGHGRAALLLVESLLHGLCENATFSPHEAVEIAERAVTVQLSQAEEANGDTAEMWRSHALLSSIAASLRLDDIDEATRPR